MGKVHIFWDNSNIHYVGLNNVFPLKEPGEKGNYLEPILKDCSNWRTEIGTLVKLILLVVSLQKVTSYGSI